MVEATVVARAERGWDHKHRVKDESKTDHSIGTINDEKWVKVKNIISHLPRSAPPLYAFPFSAARA